MAEPQVPSWSYDAAAFVRLSWNNPVQVRRAINRLFSTSLVGIGETIYIDGTDSSNRYLAVVAARDATDAIGELRVQGVNSIAGTVGRVAGYDETTPVAHIDFGGNSSVGGLIYFDTYDSSSMGVDTKMTIHEDGVVINGAVQRAALTVYGISNQSDHVSVADLGTPGQYLIRVFSTTTTDGSAKTIETIATSSNQTLTVAIDITGRRTGGAAGTANDSAGYRKIATFKNNAGTLSQLGSTTDVHVVEDQAAWDVGFNISGTDLQIQVTGATDNNVSWRGSCTYNKV